MTVKMTGWRRLGSLDNSQWPGGQLSAVAGMLGREHKIGQRDARLFLAQARAVNDREGRDTVAELTMDDGRTLLIQYVPESGAYRLGVTEGPLMAAKSGDDELRLLRSYENGPRIWDAAAILPAVWDLAGKGLIELAGGNGAYQLTGAGRSLLDGLSGAPWLAGPAAPRRSDVDRSLTSWARSTASSLGLITGQGLEHVDPKTLAFLRGKAASTIRAIDKIAPPPPKTDDELRAEGRTAPWPGSGEDEAAWVTPGQHYALGVIAEDYGHGPVTRSDVAEIIRLAALALQEGEQP